MHRAIAYAALAEALNATQLWPSGRLTELAGRGSITNSIENSGETIEIEISVSWVGSGRSTVLVRGTARGPSHWQLERIDEHIEVPISADQQMHSKA